jgi:formylglycine-generating enzyme
VYSDNHFLQKLDSGISFPLRLIQGGTFTMGEDKHSRPITVPNFYMAQYPVTQALYEAVMETNPSYFKGANRPVESVSWYDAKDFIQKLNTLTKKDFRLPSEAEWEYAARGGIYHQVYEYCGSDDLKQVGWHAANSCGETKPVGLLLPNELGLYDMSGNVYEWCEDDWDEDYKSNSRPDDVSVWRDSPEGTYRSFRGGFYYGLADICSPWHRNSYNPVLHGNIIGFRLALSLQS